MIRCLFYGKQVDYQTRQPMPTSRINANTGMTYPTIDRVLIDRILVAGASARAIAAMAGSTGYQVLAADLFSDRDTQQLAECRRANSFDRFSESVSSDSFDAWLMAGGTENHPDVIRSLNQRARMLGPDPTSILRCRDFRALRRFLQTLPSNLPRMPETYFLPEQEDIVDRLSVLNGRCKDSTGLSGDHSAFKWIYKPAKGAGGHSIRFVSTESLLPSDADCFVQRRVFGHSFSGLFVASGTGCKLLELFHPFRASNSPSPFRYEGSISGCELSSGDLKKIQRVGTALASEFSITGLFGIDFILAPDKVYLLEINPRIPASAEVSRIDASELFQLHVNATTGIPSTIPAATRRPRGKVVIYNDGPECTISNRLSDYLLENAQMSGSTKDQPGIQFADIPNPDEVIRTGQPMFTALASGRDLNEVDRKLNRQVQLSRSIDSLIDG